MWCAAPACLACAPCDCCRSDSYLCVWQRAETLGWPQQQARKGVLAEPPGNPCAVLRSSTGLQSGSCASWVPHSVVATRLGSCLVLGALCPLLGVHHSRLHFRKHPGHVWGADGRGRHTLDMREDAHLPLCAWAWLLLASRGDGRLGSPHAIRWFSSGLRKTFQNGIHDSCT
jgi:hypothetical protein